MGEESLRLLTFEAVTKFKSVSRAQRRGNVASDGSIYPRRPFNNRKGRPVEDIKRRLYFGIVNAKKRIEKKLNDVQYGGELKELLDGLKGE